MEKFKLKEGVVFRKEEDGALLYDHETSMFKPFNATAAAMCEMLFIEFKSKDEVLEEIKKQWRVKDEAVVKKDIDGFIAGMKNLNLITPRE